MIVDPYRRPPSPPVVCLLDESGRVVSERGKAIELDRLPDDHRVWCSYDTAKKLVRAGQGEALCWNGDEIRWRHKRFEDGWKPRPSDVSVIKLQFPDEPRAALTALANWRDWLARYRASPTGTTGSAAWSLLRSTLWDQVRQSDRTLFCTWGDAPPLRRTMGGRSELGRAGPGSFTGQIEQWDMSAAYASTFAGLLYGGVWKRIGELPVRHDPDWWAQGGRMVYVKARVRIPEQPLGPLVRRRGALSAGQIKWDSVTDPRALYPIGCTLTGIWAWPELQAALDHGTQLQAIVDGWVMLGGWSPFQTWWAAVEDGRSMGTLSGQLAKMTGNALWGRFCMDGKGGRRTIRGKVKGRKPVSRPLERKGGLPPAHDLAEYVAGTVRGRLYGAMVAADTRLLSAHTDGFWCYQLGGVGLDSRRWRLKKKARRFDVIDPQQYRAWPRNGAPPEVILSGHILSEAPEAFERLWSRGGYGADRAAA